MTVFTERVVTLLQGNGIIRVIGLVSVIGSSVVILLLAPVEDSNKPLDATETVVFKKRTKVVLYVLVGMVVIFQIVRLPDVSHCIMLALITLSIMLVLGKLKNLGERKNIVKTS